MRHVIRAAMLTIGVAGLAPPVYAACPNIKVDVQAPRTGATLSVRPNTTINGRACLYYVEVGGGINELTFVFSREGGAVTEVAVPPEVTAFTSTPDSLSTALTIRLRTDETHTLAFTVPEGERTATVEVYLVRKPVMMVESATSDCATGQICLLPGVANHITFGGENLAEVDVTEGVMLGATRLPLRHEGDHLVADVPATGLTKAPTNITFRTKHPFLNAANQAAFTITLPNIAVSESTTRDFFAFEMEEREGDPVVFIGQNRVATVRAPRGRRLNVATYTIKEMTGQEQGTTVGLLDVLQSDNETATVRLLGLSPTVNDLHDHGSFVYVMDRNTIVFHSRLSVRHRPLVEGWTIHRTNTLHRDQSVHPGEDILLTVRGKNLEDFDSVSVGEVPCPQACRVETPSPDEMRIRFPFLGPAVDRLPVRLGSRRTRDTTIYLPTAPALQPRPLDFATLVVDSVHFHFRPRNFTFRERRPRYFLLGSRKWIADSAQVEIGTNTLHGMRLVFDTRHLNTGGIFGPQHMVVAAALYSPAGDKVEEDSIRVSIAPLDTTIAGRRGLAAKESLSGLRIVSLDDLVDRLGRFSQPGSSVEITIRHDSIRYGGEPGYREQLRIRNTTRWRVRPHAEVLAGAFYLARTRGPRVRTLAPTGAPADSVLSVAPLRTRFNALSLLGSVGVEAAVLNDEGRPTLARARLGLLAMESPFDGEPRRQFGMSMLYPLELVNLRGGVALNISAGGVCLFNGRCFGLVSPGFSMTLGN